MALLVVSICINYIDRGNLAVVQFTIVKFSGRGCNHGFRMLLYRLRAGCL